MTLDQYLRLTGETQTQFGARVGAHPITVHKWVTGKEHPSPDAVSSIMAVTGRAVMPNDIHWTWENRVGD